MNISNFHTHTSLCKHAEGTPADYVKKAQEQGCSELGFSDHCPYPETMIDMWPDIRMTEDQASDYIRMIKSSSASVSFPVHVGFECEYDRNYISWYRDELLGRFGAEYLVLGPHWVTDGSRHIYPLDFNLSKTLLHKYIDQMIEGIKSGLYRFLAHPDLFMAGWIEWDKDSASCLNAVLDAAIDCKMPIEINGQGINRDIIHTSRGVRYQYPYDEFWQCVAQKKAEIICNSDAHKPDCVIRYAQDARNYAARLGLTPIETIF